MKKRSTRVAAIVLMLAILAAGCAQQPAQNTNPSAVPDATPTPASQQTETNTGELEPITLTMFDCSLNKTYDDFLSPVALEIQARTGVTLQVESAVGGDPTEKLTLMLAAGDYPDMIFPENALPFYYDAGVLLEVEDLMNQYAPNLMELYGEFYPRLRYSADDPRIFKIGSRTVYNEPTFPNARTWVQHAVVKEFGYPELKTLAQLEELIKAYAERYPEINGQPTIPLLAPTEGTRLVASFIQSASEITGDYSNATWSVDEDYNVTYHLRRPEEREFFRWCNLMFNEGILDPETFIQKEDVYLSKLSSGRVLAVIDANWGMNPAKAPLTESGMLDRWYGVYPIMLDDSMSHKVVRASDWTATSGIYLTDNCKDPVRAIQFLDFIASEEGQILTHWGLEGTHWEYDADGKRQWIPEVKADRETNKNFAQTTGVGLYSFPFPQWGSKKDSTGNYVNPDAGLELIKANYTDIEREVLAGYNAETWLDLFPKDVPNSNGAGVPTIEDSNLLDKANYIYNDLNLRRIPEAIMAKPGDFDKVWDSYLDDLTKAGADEVEAESTRLLRDRLIQWEVIK